jgi:hypothetical protein
VGLIWLLLIVAAAVIALFAYAWADNSNKAKEMRSAIAALPDFAGATSYVSIGGTDGIAIDDVSGKICFLHRVPGRVASCVVDGRDIISAEIFEDTVTRTVQSRGGAVVMLGRVGAIVGGPGNQVSTEKVTRLELRIVVSNPAIPVHTFTFLGTEAQKGSSSHTLPADLAREWQARIKVLANRAHTAAAAAPQLSTSIADELRKLASLKAEGLLSEDEFGAQRSKLLS